MAHNTFPDPEMVIYSALAESVSEGVLNFEPQVLSVGEKHEELQWLAAYVLVNLRSRGYKVIRQVPERRARRLAVS
jgi:hypothetical protein